MGFTGPELAEIYRRIGHSSCILAQRPSMGVMLNTQGEPRDGAGCVLVGNTQEVGENPQ